MFGLQSGTAPLGYTIKARECPQGGVTKGNDDGGAARSDLRHEEIVPPKYMGMYSPATNSRPAQGMCVMLCLQCLRGPQFNLVSWWTFTGHIGEPAHASGYTCICQHPIKQLPRVAGKRFVVPLIINGRALTHDEDARPHRATRIDGHSVL